MIISDPKIGYFLVNRKHYFYRGLSTEEINPSSELVSSFQDDFNKSIIF